MAADVTVKVTGIEGMRAALLAIPAKLRKRALRQALAAGARLVQREARRLTPTLKLSTLGGASAFRRGVRKPGTVRKAISVRTSKLATRRGDVGVFVNVRPLKTGRSAKNPNDPYYWSWLNFGWNPAGASTGGRGRTGVRQRRQINRAGGDKAKPGAGFLQAGARMLGAALQVFTREIGPRLQRLNQGPRAEP